MGIYAGVWLMGLMNLFFVALRNRRIEEERTRFGQNIKT